LEFREALAAVITGALLLGLLAIGIGILSWTMAVLVRFAMPWQVQLVACGLVVILLASVAAKLLSD